jgi:ADP-ribose pyrophosphatase
MPEPETSNARPPTVLDRRRGFDGKLVHVRVDRVRLPSGRETTREIVEHPGAVAILPITVDGQVLFLRQYHHAIGQALLGIPAGTREPGENPAETARRELIEETGYRAGRVVALGSFFTSPGYSSEQMTLYRADSCRLVGTAPALDELIDLVPLPVAELPTLVEPGASQLVEAKSLIAVLWHLRQESTAPSPKR